MKKNATGIAILSATDNGDGGYPLLPAGRFHACDRRPFDVAEGWLINADITTRLIAGVRALNQDVLIDSGHNQLRKDQGLSPDKLVAAGWFNADEMQWRDRDSWFIKYGFLSAVFPYDKTGVTPVSEDLAQVVSDKPLFSRNQRGFI